MSVATAAGDKTNKTSRLRDISMKERYSRLKSDAAHGNTDGVLNSIKQGLCPDGDPKSFKTPLMAAAANGKSETLLALIENGANLNIVDKDGSTALMYAAVNGKNESVKILVEKGAEIDAMDDFLYTAIMKAAACGYKDIVRTLLQKKAKVFSGDEISALSLAARRGHLEVVKLILEECEPKKKDYELYQALTAAVMGGHLEVVQYLVQQGAICRQPTASRFSAVHEAAGRGFTEILKYLLEECGADAMEGSYDGSTPLMFAARNGRVSTATVLLEAGAAKSALHRSAALYEAARNNHAKIVEIIESYYSEEMNY